MSFLLFYIYINKLISPQIKKDFFFLFPLSEYFNLKLRALLNSYIQSFRNFFIFILFIYLKQSHSKTDKAYLLLIFFLLFTLSVQYSFVITYICCVPFHKNIMVESKKYCVIFWGKIQNNVAIFLFQFKASQIICHE